MVPQTHGQTHILYLVTSDGDPLQRIFGHEVFERQLEETVGGTVRRLGVSVHGAVRLQYQVEKRTSQKNRHDVGIKIICGFYCH